MKYKYKIAVSGAAETGHCSGNIENISRELGKEIVKQGCVLITGATTGVPYYAAQGTNKLGGISIGFSPATSELEHKKVYKLPTDEFDVMVYTGFDYSGRNLLMTRAADAVIVACGRMGTLNEFTIAYEDRKPVGVLIGSGGTADLIKDLTKRPHKKRGEIIYDSDPKRLVQKLVKYLKQRSK
ncbi:MAG: hypothetical protein Q8P63_02520 [Candidatus Nealsonbacteria bacterium]|nr:hypothetical protein [Candidatus Nealsonbacteria bacterium]